MPRQPLSQQAQAAVRQYILDNELGPGDALPSERHLATLLDMGKTSIREAVRALESLGIIEVRHGRGLFVANFSLDTLVRHLPYGLMVRAAPLRDMLQVRRALEEGLIEQAAAVLDAPALRDLDVLVQQMVNQSVDGVVPTTVDREFHLGLFRPLNNSLVLDFIDSFWAIYDLAPGNLKSTRVHHTAQMHQAIVDALRSKDPDRMRTAVADHFVDIQNHLTEPDSAERT